MKVKGLLLMSFLIFFSLFVTGQTVKGYIISIENEAVYVDLTSAQVKAGDRLDVYVRGGYMTHPVTGKRIKKGDELIGSLEIGDVFSEYSVARPYDRSLLPKLNKGMEVKLAVVMNASSRSSTPVSSPSVNEIMTQSFVSSGNDGTLDKVAVVVAQAQVNDVVNSGHFGGYVADILMEQMLMCDKVRLLDRSILNAQIDEISLAGDLLDERTTIQRGKGIGARYILQTTMQKPDVANIRTGIPLASIMGAVQGLTGTNIGAAYASNMEVATLKASVSISVRVVDLQTGEIVFMCSGTGKAQGKSQLALEYGALGGGELNGGAGDFKQTVTGKAIQQAFVRIGRTLNDFFNGKTDKKVMGSVSGGRWNSGDKMYAKRYKLYLGTDKMKMEDARIAFADNPELFFKYRKAQKEKWLSWIPLTLGVGSTVGFAFAVIANEKKAVEIVPSGLGMVLGIGGGVLLQISAKRRVRNIAKRYNYLQTHTSSNFSNITVPQLNLALHNNSIGLCLTF